MTHVVGKPAPSSQRRKQLGLYVIISGHRGLAVMQNSPFSSLAMAVSITNTHCAYPWRDGQAELTWVAGYTEIDFPVPGVEPRTQSPIPVLTGHGIE